MFGFHRPHGHASNSDHDTSTEVGALDHTPDEPNNSGLHSGAWSDEVLSFAAKRMSRYGEFLEEMRRCRSLFELAAVQQRWFLRSAEDYAAFMAGRSGAPDEKSPSAPSD
jgi:hypothetical protein